jgi:hypothetical protein
MKNEYKNEKCQFGDEMQPFGEADEQVEREKKKVASE